MYFRQVPHTSALTCKSYITVYDLHKLKDTQRALLTALRGVVKVID
jgi:hypothetical protein